MARGLARRILEADLTNDRERIAQAFRWCVARYPSEEELSILQRLLSDQRQSLQASPQEALELMGRFAGESPPAVSADPQEWAAWICVANTLLNLDETMSKE